MQTLPDLPIVLYQDEIVSAVQKNQVTIIAAETGAGKSTQVPQYLAESGYQKIIVTQPRIIAARTLSGRVREEHTLRTGDGDPEYVAYRSSYERDDTNNTVILYCTDGLQLVREITGSGTMSNQILILDEIHEWNENMEVLLAWAKRRCKEEEDFKLVLMSATIDTDSLQAYFNAGSVITVPGRVYPVTIRTAKDVLSILTNEMDTHNTLVFLPGKAEIESVMESIAEEALSKHIAVIPLHSQLSAEAQQNAFALYPQGKLILSTNIAQTSVTIEDIDLVIDSGLERRIEVENGVEGLFIGQISQADCMQRAGRAGRTKPGEYVLASFNGMPCLGIEERAAYATPEILRKHIDRLVLRLASAGFDIEELEFYHPPPKEAVLAAKQKLHDLGAITDLKTVTALGRKMERFPVESSYARMLVEAELHFSKLLLPLAVIIGIQEVGGIVGGGSRNTGWLKYVTEKESDLLAQYEVYLAIQNVDPELYEDLGILDKAFIRAQEVIRRICLGLGLTTDDLAPLRPEDRMHIMRCIAAGLVDQIWVVEKGLAFHLGKDEQRELSSGTVVKGAALVVGTPFDLEINTQYGLEILHLLQAITALNPVWLPEIAPNVSDVQKGKTFYDADTCSLATTWKITLQTRITYYVRIPVTEKSEENHSLFLSKYALWVFEKLQLERRQLKKKTHRKIPDISLLEVQKKLQPLLYNALCLYDLTLWQRESVSALARLSGYYATSPVLKKRRRYNHG